MKKLIDKMVDIPYNNDIKYEVIYFRFNDNRYPVKVFINDIVDNKLKAKVYRSLILLESNGRNLENHIVNIWKKEYMNYVLSIVQIR